MARIGGLVDGRLPTVEELLAQVQGAIDENLALANVAPRGVTYDRYAGLRKPKRPFATTIEPQVGEDAAAARDRAERERVACECRKQRSQAMCQKTNAASFEVGVLEPGTQVLPRNSQRAAILFSVVAGSACLFRTPDFPIGDTPLLVLPQNASIQLVLRDYGPLLWEPWNALGQAGASTISLVETVFIY